MPECMSSPARVQFLGGQLDASHGALEDVRPGVETILMAEVA